MSEKRQYSLAEVNAVARITEILDDFMDPENSNFSDAEGALESIAIYWDTLRQPGGCLSYES